MLFFYTCAYYFVLIGLLIIFVDASFTIRSDYRLQNCLLTLVFQFKVIKARSVTACANWPPGSNSLFCIKSSIFRNVKFISCNAKCRVCLSSLLMLNHLLGTVYSLHGSFMMPVLNKLFILSANAWFCLFHKLIWTDINQ